MKFAVAVVMLAVATTVQASLIAQVSPGVSHVTSAALHPGLLGGIGLGAWGGLGAHGLGVHGLGVHGPAAVAVHAAAPLGHLGLSGPAAWGVPGLTGPAAWGVPGISLSQGPGHVGAPLGLGHGLGLGHSGVYVAKTRGAVHTAPLAGHISSAASINVAPAPGTH